MKQRFIIIAIFALSGGCSAFDFFQYRENTGLQAVEKPDGYGSVNFGAKLSYSGTPEYDLLAVSGGQGERVVVYKLSQEGSLTDLNEHWKQFPSDNLQDDITNAARGTGASLQGLPVFFKGGTLIEGVFAIGEPDFKDGKGNVKGYYPEDNKHYDLKPQLESSKGFGRVLAGVRPGGDEQWLLVVGFNKGFEVISAFEVNDANDQRSESVADDFGSGYQVSELAAGRFPADDENIERSRIFVAAATRHTDKADHRVHLYFSDQYYPKRFTKVACLADPDDPGFGGALAAGDLDGDGTDELVVGSLEKNRVRVFDILELASAFAESDDCLSLADDIPTLATLTPEEGEWDVTCKENCGFGTALAIGDIATDDDGPELVIGAYKADVEGVDAAGAVYIYRNWQRNGETFEGTELAGQVFVSSPKADQEFGRSVVIAPMAGRNELIVGAPDSGRFYVAFCTGVGQDIKAGADVTGDGNGKVVSTRCRR
jgi:hypothetical protein